MESGKEEGKGIREKDGNRDWSLESRKGKGLERRIYLQPLTEEGYSK